MILWGHTIGISGIEHKQGGALEISQAINFKLQDILENFLETCAMFNKNIKFS